MTSLPLRALHLAMPVRMLFVVLCFAAIIALGMLRIETNAQFTFASLMLLPVLASAWLAGRFAGWAAALLSAIFWGYADSQAAGQEPVGWIPPLNALVHFVNYAIVIEILLKLVLLLEREAGNARVDGLTGLLNRRGFMEAFERQAELSKRLHHSVSLAYIDLDGFKQLNDTFGHPTGDGALKAVGLVLENATRSTDIAGRLGGDEFCVAYVTRTAGDAETQAARIHSQLVCALKDFPGLGASVGVACFEHTDVPAQDMIRQADRLMYEVKDAGKGRVLFRAC